MKTCPDCAEEVQDAARVCRYCGHRFDGEGAAAGVPEKSRPPRRGRRLALIGISLLVVAAVALGVAWYVGALDFDDGATVGNGSEVDEEALAAAKSCERKLDPLLSELEELDSRLNVGVNYDEYSDLVGDASVAYDQISYGRLKPDCVRQVGLPTEKALNSYIDASNAWNRCISDLDCADNEVDPELQDHWADASNLIDSANDGLSALRNP